MHILLYNTTYFGWKLYYLESTSVCNLTAIEFPVSCMVFLQRFVNISMLISEKLNHRFVGNHCFSNHKIVNFAIFYQMLFIRIRNVSQDWNAFLPFDSTVMVVPVQELTRVLQNWSWFSPSDTEAQNILCWKELTRITESSA